MRKLLLIMLVALSAVACKKQKIEKNIVGTWQQYGIEVCDSINECDYSTVMSNGEIVFTEDTFSPTTSLEYYSYFIEKGVVHVDYGTDDIETYTVEMPSNDELRLISDISNVTTYNYFYSRTD